MELGALLAEVGQAAHLPEARDRVRRTNGRGNRSIIGEATQHGEVDRFWRGHEFGARRRGLEIGNEHRQAVAARFGLAPEQPGQRRKLMFLDRIDFFGV